eukprot:242897_1
MSVQKKRAELLTFGYIQQHCPCQFPFVLKKLIQLFYDVFIYWTINGDKVAKFLSAKNGDAFGCKQIFKIKDIQFGYKMYPNGKSSNDKGMVSPFLRLKHMPSVIEYIGIYYQFKCEQTQCVHNRFKKFYRKKASGIYLMHLAKCRDFKRIDFDCFVDIKYIKYKTKCNKTDYTQPMTMRRHVVYRWPMDKATVRKCVALQMNEYILSDSFDANNWNLRFYHSTDHDSMHQKIAIDLNCIGVPFGITYFTAKWTVCIKGDVELTSDKTSTFEEPHFNATICFDLPHKLENEISINIEIDILNVWDDDRKIVHLKDWTNYCIVDNLP